MIETKSNRSNLFGVLKTLGALMAFMFRFSKFLLMGRQNFYLATNFMRKIYSVHEDQDGDDDSKKIDDGEGLINNSLKNSMRSGPMVSMDNVDDNQ